MTTIEPSTRVCPGCGEPAAEPARCPTCGANLAAMRGMLPTRAEWEAANPGPSATAPRLDSPADHADRQQKGRPRWAPSGNFRKQAIASVAVIAAFGVVLITATSPGTPHPGRAGRVTHPSPVAVASTTAPVASTSTPAVSTKPPTVAACVAAWNGGKSAEHRRDLAMTVAHAANAVAVLATYIGRGLKVARVGGGNPVLVNADMCVIAADNLVFIRQPDGSWGLTKATSTQFSSIALDHSWTADHANLTVRLGSSAAGRVTVSRKNGSLVVLRS